MRNSLAKLLLLAAAMISPVFADAPRPNIIFVLTDDLGYGDVGVYYQRPTKGQKRPTKGQTNN